MQVMEFRERLEECESEDEAQGIRDENEGEFSKRFQSFFFPPCLSLRRSLGLFDQSGNVDSSLSSPF